MHIPEHEHDHLLGKESPHNHIMQLTCLIVFIIISVLDSFVFKFSVGITGYVSLWIRLIMALALILIGITIMRSAEKMLFHETQSSVIDRGLFAYVRHPLYLGILLIYLGFVLGSFSILSFVAFVLIFFMYNYLAIFEEKDLERAFGEEYLEYKKRVSRWIPRFWN
ncbi:MAG: isoprenylcysteine carboxylmethyltransferase family protein [Candidatus Bathyarchaeia archaeon]